MCFLITPHITLLLFLLSTSNAINRTDCIPGTLFNGTTCNPCPAGTYQYNSGRTTCTPCPPGTYYPFTGGLGRDICLPCPKNTFNRKAGGTSLSACKRCPRGTGSAPYSSHCIACPAGNQISTCEFLAPVVDGLCLECYRFMCYTVEPQPFCKICPRTYFARGPNSHKCRECPLGSNSNKGSPRCTECPGGPCKGCRAFAVYDPSSVYNEFIDGPVLRSGGCRPCPAGFSGNREINATRCVRCAPGTFKQDGETGPCTPCAADPSSIASGSSCALCNKQQKFNPEQQICDSCPRNHESDGGKAKNCRPCARGSVGDREGCRCIPGWAPNGSGGCRICPPGTSSPRPYDPPTCQQCFEGSIAPLSGTPAGQCRSCPDGKLTNAGRTKCVACPRGLKERFERCVSPATNCPPGQTRTNVVHSSGTRGFTCE